MAKKTQVNFDFLQIGLASPDRVRSWSRGEVKKPETINYRTLKPERDGLFCEKIFGPSKDWECYCGRYKRVRHKGIVCPRCGVEVTESKVRRERMGHIDLAAPVVHIWYFKGTNSYLGQLLGLPTRELEEVIYFNAYLVLDAGKTEFKKHQILYEDEYEKYLNELGAEADTLVVGMGAEVIKTVLENLDLAAMSVDLKQEAKEANKTKLPKIQKRRKIVENFLKSGNDPVNILLEALPVLPPDLRPMVQLDGGRFATSDLNDLYRRVINRNNRLKKLKDIFAPEIIIRNEKRMLQEAVDALIANGKRGKVVVGTNNRPLKSLTNIIEGKQGRFRQNLLGKRVDYSGRSVIVVGPTLKLHQCGLPKEMAIELFKPFVMHRLMAKNYVQNIKAARMMIERNDSRIWDCLAEVIKDHYILLNRAPTLHRLGIQAFEPILIEGRAIKLHPLVCTAFNADFDGDQMAIHIPLSVEAQAEAQLIMASDNNILSPATGRPIIVPAQDMVLGCYYLTIDDPRESLGKGMVFTDENEAITAYDLGKVGIHAQIVVRINYGGKTQKINTTVGRVIFNQSLPEEMRFINKTIDKKVLENIINDCYLRYGAQPTAHLADKIKDIGYKFATRAGVSISITDLVIPQNKKEILAAAEESIERARHSYLKGEITEVERYSKVIDTWAEVTEELTSYISSDYDKLNSVYMMAFSGARGNISQVRQLVAMRGLMADPSGRIIDMPIKSNFREGLNVTEYVISTYGARKGIVDTALRTADSGYLTRRLVDVAQDVIVREHDCGTADYITMKPIEEGDKILVGIGERVRSRYVAEDVIDPKTGEVILQEGEIVELDMSKKIDALKLHSLKVRSVLTCNAQYGVCRKCYGFSLANQQEAEIGDAVGIIAAQSIGEPGTQLTMRTFHTGGVYSAASTKMVMKAKQGGVVRFTKTSALSDIRTRHGLEVKTNETSMEVTIEHSDNTKEVVNIPASFAILVHDGQVVGENAIIAESLAELNRGARKSTEKGFKELRADFNGELIYDGFNVNVIKEDRQTKQNERGTKQADKAGVIWLLAGEVYPVTANAELKVKNGDAVKAGDVLTTANTSSKFGGTIRYGEVQASETADKNGRKLTAGKDITIEIAKIANKNGKIDTSKRNLILKLDNGEVYNLKVTKDSKVEHGMIIAESLPDDKFMIKESGQIIIPPNSGLEKDGESLTGPVAVLFVPTEAHKVHKDISLLKKVSGSRVDAGTELVKDIYADNDGIVEVTIINDIIDEIKVWRSLEDFTVPIETAVLEKDGALVKAGTSLTRDISATKEGILKILNLNDSKILIIRPVQKFEVDVDTTGPQWKADGVAFGTVQKTKLNVKNNEVITITGNARALIRKEVILNLPKELGELIGQVEFAPLANGTAKPKKGAENAETEEKFFTLQIVLLESLALVKNFENTKKVLKNEEKLIDTYMLVDDGAKVKKGEPLATSIIRSKIDGFASIGMEGATLTSLVIVPHNVYKTYNIAPKENVLVKKGDIIREGTSITESTQVSEGGEVSNITKNSITIRQGRPYLIKAGTLLMQDNKSMVQQGDSVATLIYEKLKTGDIIQGLPRVEELLEAREPKDTAVLAEIEGTVVLEMNNDLVTKLAIIDMDGVEHDEYTRKVTISSTPVVNSGDHVKPGDMLINGVINPHDLLRTKGVTVAQTYLVDSIQQVYRSQGVAINDKHIEVIVRQMTKKVRINEPGDTKYLVQELAERKDVLVENASLAEESIKAQYEDILLGITKASLNTTSFISAASFQETGRVLTEAAIEGKKDFLRGLKENVIIGRLIPAGTGLATLDNPIYEDNIEDEEASYVPPMDDIAEYVIEDSDFNIIDADEAPGEIEIADEETDVD